MPEQIIRTTHGTGIPYVCNGAVTTIWCTCCQKEFTLPITQAQIDRWDGGPELIQNAMPNLSAADRELFLSGNCNDCFEAIFADNDEEEDQEDDDAF